MTAFMAVWAGMAAIGLAVANLVATPFEWRLLLMLLWAFPGALPATLGGLVLWSHRKADAMETGVAGQKAQAWAAIWMTGIGVGINCAYLLWYYLTHVR